MIRATDPSTANMMPAMPNGEAHYVCLMPSFQEHSLRTADERGQLDIQKAAATTEGRNISSLRNGAFYGKLKEDAAALNSASQTVKLSSAMI